MGRALEGQLANLHGALADAFLDKLNSGEVTASDLNVIRQFLKDNNISCIGEKNDTMSNIVSLLPSFDADDMANEG